MLQVNRQLTKWKVDLVILLHVFHVLVLLHPHVDAEAIEVVQVVLNHAVVELDTVGLVRLVKLTHKSLWIR